MAVQNFGSGGGGYQLSPGVNISEIDLTTVVPPVATTVGAFAGVFRWGPVGQRVLITSENDLVAKFGKPTTINPETFFSAANFLSYSNALYVSRAANTSSVLSAIANTAAVSANSTLTVKNDDDYEVKVGTFNTDVKYIARFPGSIGNSLKVSVCESANQFNSSIPLAVSNGSVNSSATTTGLTISVGSNTATVTIANGNGWAPANSSAIAFAQGIIDSINTGDIIELGNNSIGKQTLKVVSKGTANAQYDGATFNGDVTFTLTFDQPLKLSTNIATTTINRFWEFYNQFDRAPGRSTFVSVNGNTAAQLANTSAQLDELHVVVVDEDGAFTGSPGAVLEVFDGVSRATDAKLSDGTSNYYKTVINDTSKYVWWANDRSGATSANALNVATSSNPAPFTLSFQGGTDNDETTVPLTDLAQAFDLFSSVEEVDISLVVTGKARGGTYGEQLANYLIDNIAEVRRDCIVFVSPDFDDVVNKPLDAADNVVEFRNALRSTSFAVMDSGYKYQYDKYNDVYRYVPLNGDIAGLCVRTDNVRDPWYSPAGTNRGQVRNVVKLAFNPNKPQRDLLYKNGVNPVITQAGQGTILYGDKTLLAKPSAFDRINVRRLFIVLEKAISTAAKSFLFEFNDEFTRTQFRNLVEPFLRDVQGRRGIYDFKVVCDETNNTPEVIDSNRFVGDIYVKPARSINYIQLNFVAVRSGIEFSEIVG